MEQSSEPQGVRRAYRKPELKVLGDLATLTKNVSFAGGLDGGHDYYGTPLHTRY